MKKLSVLSLAVLLGGTAMAEGYQVNLLSAKQAGMGHVGVAMKLGAESMHFNPAGLGFMEGTADFSVGVSGIMAEATYKNGDYKHKTDNDISTPMYAYAGFRIYDNLKAGIALTTPYGSGLNWGKEWAGAALVQDISLQSFCLQPTLSWKIMDRLSIGAGLSLYKGNFSLSRAVLPAGALNQLAPLAPALGPDLGGQLTNFIKNYGDVNLLSATLSGHSGVRVGYNVGVMFDVNDKITLGASYRSKVGMRVKEGKAELTYANEAELKSLIGNLNKALGAIGKDPIVIPPLDEGTFKAELPLPANLTVGVSYKPTSKLQLAFDLQTVFWSAYQNLDVQFTENVLGGYSIKAEKNYKNTVIARVGGEYALTDRFDLRAGVYFDQSPIRSDYYNPETPGMNKIGTSVGFSFRPFTGFSIDFSALYIAGLSRDGSYPVSETQTFSGHYGTSAFAPTLGLSYSF
ncbi:MAG: OmpP1/FadL family transporter [Bacteroidales bacterium]